MFGWGGWTWGPQLMIDPRITTGERGTVGSLTIFVLRTPESRSAKCTHPQAAGQAYTINEGGRDVDELRRLGEIVKANAMAKLEGGEQDGAQWNPKRAMNGRIGGDENRHCVDLRSTRRPNYPLSEPILCFQLPDILVLSPWDHIATEAPTWHPPGLNNARKTSGSRIQFTESIYDPSACLHFNLCPTHPAKSRKDSSFV